MIFDGNEDDGLEDSEKEECGNCNGTGEADCPMEYGGACPDHCPACGGSQKITCQDCNGDGYCVPS